MSIAENVGAVSRHLNELRTAPLYLGAKRDVHEFLAHIPVVGKQVEGFIEKAKHTVKSVLIRGVLFEELGFRYFGPVDGHDIQVLTDVLNRIRKIDGPVLLHVLTTKGKGYNKAENAPSDYHSVYPCEAGDAEHRATRPVRGAYERVCSKTNNGETYTDVFSKVLIKQAAADKSIVAITAAMPDGAGLCPFKRRYPDRFFDVGIAESHAVTFAAGLAKAGMRPVVAVYSSFLQRAYDQILHDVALQNLPVVFAVSHAGLVGEEGETHQGLYDIAFLSHIPNMTLLAPKNKKEMAAMLRFAFTLGGPAVVRYPKENASICLPEANTPIEYGRAETIQEGSDIALVSVGAMMDKALAVLAILEQSKFSVGLYNARFIKPLDMGLVARLSRYPFVAVLADSAKQGGYGSLLNAAMAQKQIRLLDFALPDVFVGQGTREELFKQYRLDAESIAAAIINKQERN
jgi:1-deoxy-D-xylulose-5-phosphate synthase